MESNPVYEIPANEYNSQLALALKQIQEFKQPEWVDFVKTGVAKIKPSQEKDFWHKRAASILRQIYIRRAVGVGRLRTRYGSKQNRGMKPEKFRKGSGKIIRVILQQAESAGLLEKYNIPGKRAGRKLTKKGKELLENIQTENRKKKDKEDMIMNVKNKSHKKSELIQEKADKKILEETEEQKSEE